MLIQKVAAEAVRDEMPMMQNQKVDAEVVKGTDREPKVQMLKIAGEGSIQKVAVGGGADPGRSQASALTEAVGDGLPMGQTEKDDSEVSKGMAPRVQMRKIAEEVLCQKAAVEGVRDEVRMALIQKADAEAVRDGLPREQIRKVDAEVVKDKVPWVQIRKAAAEVAKDGEPKVRMQEAAEEVSIQKVAEMARVPKAQMSKAAEEGLTQEATAEVATGEQVWQTQKIGAEGDKDMGPTARIKEIGAEALP